MAQDVLLGAPMSFRPILALFTSLALAAPAAVAAPDSTPTVEVCSTVTPAPADSNAAAGYAHREQQSRQVADYEGGSVIVVGVSGTALVIAVLLLLFL
jgi:hypothetical protein